MPLKYDDCPLYGVQSKRQLCYLLNIQNKAFFKQDYVSRLIAPCIISEEKPRLIEPPHNDLKKIQTRIKKYLGRIIVPDNVFSGVKGRSYVDNALYHISDKSRYLYKIDFTAFFPTISRDRVYNFFCKDLKCSPDVSKILCNFTTVDLKKTEIKDSEKVFAFLENKKIKCYNHLISGAPTSQILSYLVNHDMFDEMQTVADKNDIVMTIYVDDITFSSNHKISNRFKKMIIHIVKKYNYRISKGKIKYYTRKYPKLITGVIVSSKGQATVKNAIRHKIVREHDHLRETPEDKKSRDRLRGLVTAARQVKKDIYPTIHSYAFEKKKQR